MPRPLRRRDFLVGAGLGLASAGLALISGADAHHRPWHKPKPRPTATASPLPTPSPTPVILTSQVPAAPTPAPAAAFYSSVLLVQNESQSGFARIADGGGDIVLGHHAHAFGASCNAPTDVGTRLGWAGAVPKMLYAAIAPADLCVTGIGCDGSDSRLTDTPQVETWADRMIAVLDGDANITHVNFWNELKGYWTSCDNPGCYDAVRFCRDYITFAERVKASKPNIKIGGPYSTGGASQAAREWIHGEFVTRVCYPRPELVDFICWDHGDGSTHQWYTDFYQTRGVTKRHWNTEWYPGGHGAGTAPPVSQMVAEMLAQATNPLMEGVMIWGSGTDNNQKVDLWSQPGGVGNAYWTAWVAMAGFTVHGGVVDNGDGTWHNAVGQTLSMSGDTVVIS